LPPFVEEYIKENETLNINLPMGFSIVFIWPGIRNAGDMPAENVNVRCLSVTANPPHPPEAPPVLGMWDGTFPYIDNDRNCIWDIDIGLFLIIISDTTYTITYNQNNPGKKYSSFTIITTGPPLTPDSVNELNTLKKGIDLKKLKNMIRDHK
jgi:hypothetical protein